MVVGAFPVAKLGILLVRQVSKPIAGYIKQGAKRSTIFRNYVCVPTAQFYNWVEQRWKLWAMGFGTPQNVPRLNEEKAVELGADILSEAFLFVVAAGGLTWEYVRSSAKARKKEEAEEMRMINLENKVIELDFSNEQLRAQLRQFERQMHASPLQTLKEKFIPSSTTSKSSDQKPPAASPGTRVVTLTRADIFPQAHQHSTDDADDESKYLPVPQWRRPFAGPTTPTSTATSSSTSSTNGSTSTGQDSTRSKNGTISSQLGAIDAFSESNANDIESINSDVAPEEHAYRAKVVRRAIKILMDAYEEALEED